MGFEPHSSCNFRVSVCRKLLCDMFVTEGDGTISIHKRIINQKKSAVNINEFGSNMHDRS